jgi:diaminopimelate epimerase
MSVRFEKWVSLGNDYLVLEEPCALTAERVRALCAPHTGVGADGVLLLGPAGAAGALARLRIFNPDGSEAELSGNGARQAALYLRARGWTTAERFTIETRAGPIVARITGERTCTVAMGRAEDGGTGEAIGRRYRHIRIGNPQTSFRVESSEALGDLDLPGLGPLVERDPRWPGRTNVSFWAELAPGRIRARIWERGVGETASSGTGACGAAVASVLDGGASPVAVVLDGGELEVAVSAELDVDLAGPAAPVFVGEVVS